jgi:hypothetical protein
MGTLPDTTHPCGAQRIVASLALMLKLIRLQHCQFVLEGLPDCGSLHSPVTQGMSYLWDTSSRPPTLLQVILNGSGEGWIMDSTAVQAVTFEPLKGML